MKKFIKKCLSLLSVATLISPIMTPSIQAQDMTPSQLLIEVQENADFDMIEEIESGSFNIEGSAKVTGIQGFDLDIVGDAFGSFAIDFDAQDIQFSADGQIDMTYLYSYQDGEGNTVTDSDLEEFDGAIRLVDQIVYIYDGTNYQKQDASKDLEEYFNNLDENYEEMKAELEKMQNEMLKLFDEESSDFVDKYYTLEENSDSYTVTLISDIDIDEFLEDFRQTSIYTKMLEEMEKEYEVGNLSNEVSLDQNVAVVEEVIAFFVNSIDKASTSYFKDSYMLKDSEFAMNIAAADIFQLIDRLEEVADEPIINPEEKAAFAMMFGNLIIEFDVAFGIDSINEPVMIEAPANADEYEEITTTEEEVTSVY